MKVGDYVRTDNGCICKILKYTDISDNDFYVNTDSQYNVIYKSWIIKSSPNIIDLIEVGDYVNGMLVTNIWIDKETGNIEFEFNNHESYLFPKSWNYESRVTKYKIKSIVTHEQFSQMKYKVE